MANSLGQAWRSFWHTMTSNDRHASHNSPYRTGGHMPVSQSRHAPLTSIATSATESRHNLSYNDDSKRNSALAINAIPDSPNASQSGFRAPYSPGMRSQSSFQRSAMEEGVASSEIQMQSFADGAPPPPPVSHSWKKIDAWAEKNYEELYDQLGEGCTQNDINELEHELDCSLPQDVRDSLATHDGQERGGRPTGIIFGCMLLDCEEIVQEWKNWKKVNEEYLSGKMRQQPQYPLKSLNNASSSSSQQAQHASNKFWRQELMERQDSQPPNAIQKAYAHPSWIPLARDWGGNNIAVDLSPGPAGKWGQVILFGRDYDCKYVIARSWAAFMAVVADDLNSPKVLVDEESGEMKLKEFKTEAVEPSYMEILRWRADQKYGKRVLKRRSPGPLGLNTNIDNRTGRDSPYNSPTISNDERGRSQHRFARGPNASPRTQVGSPLARNHEEIAAPIPVRAGGDVVKDFAAGAEAPNSAKAEEFVDLPTPVSAKLGKLEKLIDGGTPIDSKPPPFRRSKLVDAPTPTATAPQMFSSQTRGSNDEKRGGVHADENKENHLERKATGLGVDGIDEMKSVQI